MGHYFGLGKNKNKARIEDADALAQFINTRASHVSQTSLYGYLRTRAGTRFPELFKNPDILISINIAKWHIWLACVSDLCIFIGQQMHQSGRDPAEIESLMSSMLDRIMRQTEIPAEAGEDIESALEKADQRIKTCDWSQERDDDTIFSQSPTALPPGVVNYVTGSGTGTGAPLLDHPKVDLVSFTGSTDTGSLVAQHCAKQMKQYSLEMGGKNAILVMDDADLNLAVEGVVWGAFGTTGQRCTACSRVIVHKKVLKKFTGLLVKRTKELKLGDGLSEKTDVGPLVNGAQREKVNGYCKIGVDEGAKLLIGGGAHRSGGCSKGFFFKPTIFGDVAPKMRIAQEEIFGPVLSVISCRSLDHGIKIVNDSAFGLSSSIYTQDVNRAFRAIEYLDTGITYINSSTIGAEIQLPFGGTKGTGNGHREAGTAALEIFTEWKSVYIDYSGKLQKAQIDD